MRQPANPEGTALDTMKREPAMRRLITTLAACLLATGLAAQSTVETAFTVNDVPVTNFDIQQRMQLLMFNGAPRTADLRAIATEQLIADRLKQEAAARRGIRATESGVRSQLEDFAAQRNLSLEGLERQLVQAGASSNALADALIADLVWRELVRNRFGSRAEPTETEIDQALALAAAGRNREYRLSELVIPTATRGEAGTNSFAAQLSDQLNREGGFEAAARRYSASISAGDGGAIGWISEGALPDPILDALDLLRPGQVSAPIPVPGAVVLLRLEDTRTSQVEGAAMSSVTLLALSAMDANSGRATERLRSVLARNPSCEAAPAQAAEAGVTAERGEPMIVSDLPEPVRLAIADVQAGGITEIVPVRGGVAAFVICARSDGPSPEMRERLRDDLREERFIRFSNAFLQELRNEAIIEGR